MSDKIVNDALNSNEKSTTTPRSPMLRSATMPSTPPSPLATNPWYQQKFELVYFIIICIFCILFY
jgi:hypothetical protein